MLLVLQEVREVVVSARVQLQEVLEQPIREM
jgi:hypothetical protein